MGRNAKDYRMRAYKLNTEIVRMMDIYSEQAASQYLAEKMPETVVEGA